MSYPNVTNVTNFPQSFFLLGGRNREHMVTSSIVFLFPNLDNWPGNRNTRNTPLEGCSCVPSAKSRILSRDEPEDVCCVALDLDRGAIDQVDGESSGEATPPGYAFCFVGIAFAVVLVKQFVCFARTSWRDVALRSSCSTGH